MSCVSPCGFFAGIVGVFVPSAESVRLVVALAERASTLGHLDEV